MPGFAKVVQGPNSDGSITISGGGVGGNVTVQGAGPSNALGVEKIDSAGTYLEPPGGPTWDFQVFPAGTVINANTFYGPYTSKGARGIRCNMLVTNLTGGQGVLEIQVWDAGQADYVVLLAGSNIAATGLWQEEVYPGLTAVANHVVNDVLSRQFRLRLNVTAGSMTASLGYSLLP